MNLVFSYGAKQDFDFVSKGHEFLGAGSDKDGQEVHVFRISGMIPVLGEAEESEEESESRSRHSVECYFCGVEFDEREGFPADSFNGGDGGTACKKCAREKTYPGSPKEDGE